TSLRNSMVSADNQKQSRLWPSARRCAARLRMVTAAALVDTDSVIVTKRSKPLNSWQFSALNKC
ncbi:hypothetical protein NY536_32595, partial [Enterobacter hormaechei]|nr:hypothetical protein [Enterobacter hormaechei]